MDNLNSPAYPQLTWEEVAMNQGKNQIATYTSDKFPGFTKLEIAAIMVVSGFAGNSRISIDDNEKCARQVVALVKAVLEEANK
jgi:hypothetical protein